MRSPLSITENQRRFIGETPERPTPFLVVDTEIVAERFRSLAAALPGVTLHYAVKSNPSPAVLATVLDHGGCFDVASPGEIELCLRAGARADQISYGNTIKKRADIAAAYALGIRLFSFDADAELDKLIELAPEATVMCRVLTDGGGADWPLSKKFGCEPEMAIELLSRAASHGLGTGLAFHVGSQQRRPEAFDDVLSEVAMVVDALADRDITIDVLNLGGGFPATYLDAVPGPDVYGSAIMRAIGMRLGGVRPKLIAEPGRYLVGDAGVIVAEVVLVSYKGDADGRRWVYLDIGKFGGLAETMDEAIRYRITTPRDGGLTGPVVIAGPTCDSADVLYDKSSYELPLDLAVGDRVLIHTTGAYTTTYSAVSFNGFPPLASFDLN